MRILPTLLLAGLLSSGSVAQWLPGATLSSTLHFQACAFDSPTSGLFVYGANNPGPSASGTEGGIVRTTTGLTGTGFYIWYQPNMCLEDIDVKLVGGIPRYIAAGHELYFRSVVLRPTPGTGNAFQFDSVRTGTNRYYRAVRMREDLVAFAAGGTLAGDGIIDMSTDTGSTWTPVAVLPGQPVSRLHFVNDGLAFAATGGYRRLNNNGILLPDSGAIYRSTDGGLNWVQVHADPDNGFSDVAFSDGSNGVATRNDGTILRTTDGGANWSPASIALAPPFVLTSATFRPDGTGFATAYRTDGSAGYILLSDDGGATWTVNFNTSGFNHSRRIYDVYFHNDTYGYASTQIRPLRSDGLVTALIEQAAEGPPPYPNPTAGTLTLWIEAPGTMVTIHDALGRTVREVGVPNDGELRLDVSDLPLGRYTLRTLSTEGTSAYPFIRL